MCRSGDMLLITSILTLVFFVLKMLGVYNWAWAAVFAPVLCGTFAESLNMVLGVLRRTHKRRAEK